MGVTDHFFDALDPRIFEEFDRRWTGGGIPFEAAKKEVLAEIGDLVWGGESGKMGCGDVVHYLLSDGSVLRIYRPFIVEISPWSSTGCHFQETAAKRPYIECAMPTFVGAGNDYDQDCLEEEYLQETCTLVYRSYC